MFRSLHLGEPGCDRPSPPSPGLPVGKCPGPSGDPGGAGQAGHRAVAPGLRGLSAGGDCQWIPRPGGQLPQARRTAPASLSRARSCTRCGLGQHATLPGPREGCVAATRIGNVCQIQFPPDETDRFQSMVAFHRSHSQGGGARPHLTPRQPDLSVPPPPWRPD